jgi:hypothetical protein
MFPHLTKINADYLSDPGGDYQRNTIKKAVPRKPIAVINANTSIPVDEAATNGY